MQSQAVRSRASWAVWAALCACLPAEAQATVFLCHDGRGGTVTTDHLGSDCLQYGGKELNPDGSVRRLILTQQQQAQQEQAQQREQAERDRQLRRQREERALLARYPDEASLQSAHAADLHSVQALIDAARQRLKVLERERHDNALDAQFYPNGNYPADLRSRMQINQTQRAEEQQMIIAQQREILRVDQRYQELLARLRPLWARQRATGDDAPAK
ncbi:hypothetical protein [Thiomonas sp. FB-6]|uniref:hypothetical protein n=1 Tax=Thiomonas sp. FB-6 TaxID=1158291 RepID=UPI00036E964D|nr:hypothetical protein [Thiomonas sp. FB-6]